MSGKKQKLPDAAEDAMGERPIHLTSCPNCGSDLTTEQGRDQYTLSDIDVEFQDPNADAIREQEVTQDQLLAWRCRSCTTFVPAHDPASPIGQLADELLNGPKAHSLVDNPFTDPARNYEGDSGQQLRSMTAEELREHERFWDWRAATTLNPYNSWWCSKAHSRATRELDRRGLSRDSQ
jgi:hypothetical protein